MYRIAYDGLTIFDPYGNANEVVSDASMSVEVNASAYLDFTMAITHPLYDTIRERAGVVTLTWDSTVLFEGIIESIEMDIQGNKSISCVSAMDYLNNTHVRPYSTVAGEADLTAPSSVDGYFQWLIDQHNDHVLDASKMFDVGINQGANLQQNNFIYRSSESEPTTASELTDQILDSLGGYLTMRYEDGRRVLDLYADLHTMNAQIVDFGINITDFTKTTDTTDQYTAILLNGGSPKFEGGDLETGDWSHWVTHPNTPLVGDKTHGGSVASYFISGTGEYINDSFFYSRPGRRYKATVYVKNERGSNVTIRGSYQYEQAGGWTTVNVNSSLTVENKDDQWVEFSFDFQPNLSEYTKIRPRWYFDNIGNDGNRRVYLDDFSFSQIEGDTEVSEDPIGLKQVPDGVSSFDADVFKSGDVLYSTSAVERYGYKEEVFEDTTITNIDDLVQAGIKELNKSKDPQITLDIKAVDLALFVEGYTHLNVGDAVRVRSAIHDTDEFLMVNSITLDLQDPGQSEYVIGKAYDSLTGQQSGFLRSLNSGINSSLDAVASLDQTTKDQAIQIGSVEQVANQAQQTANNAQNTANNAQQTSNTNKQSITDIEKQQSEQDKLIEQMQAGVEQAEQEIGGINDRLDQMDTEAGEVQKAMDSLRESTSSELQNVKDSVSGVRSDVDAVTRKAADLASELDGTKATVEQVVTEQGEIKTTVSNAATKADQSLQVSTQASQTATQAQTTATSAYEDAQTAITQSSQATQTANQVSLDLRTNYQTKTDADAKYATQSSLTATSNQIRTEVSETYATQATVNALENLANNAVQTWMGDGVPSLSNKPASDWTTSELKVQHSGDLYYDTNTGYAYRFGSSDGTSYSWALVKDTDITKALADAAKAQETAEGAQSGVNELKTSIPVIYSTKSELSQKADSITARVEEVAQAGETTSNKVAELKLTADGLQTTVKEQASKIDQNATTISQVSQKADNLSSTITQVSGRVDDVEDKADTAQGTANSAMSQASRVEQSLNSFKTSVSRDYETKSDALSKQSSLQQSVNNLRTEVSETYATKTEVEQTYSTKSYVDQTARTVSLGVVEEYKNGQHGSALATQSDITAAKDSITSTVSQTYATKAEVEQTYATKTEVKQTSDSLTVSISSAVSKAESAATAASNANSNAQNAQNRVGNLETCIKMTSDGVRVGKISNGNFTGYSALVNSTGSFDILDSSTKTLASFNKDGLRVNSSSDRGMLIGFNPKTNSGYIGSAPRKTAIGDDYIDIGMDMDFASGGNLSVIDRLGRINLIGNGIQLMTTGNDRVGINFMDVRGAGVVLFDKDDGRYYASIEIPIGYNFGEFNYIMCFFRTNDGQYFGGTAYHPNGKEYNFMTMGGGGTDMSYLKGTRWAFNGRMATRKTTFEIGPGYSRNVNDSVMHIVAILGFDYYKTSG